MKKWIDWLKNTDRIEGEDMVEELCRHLRMEDDQKPYPVIHSWQGQAPLKFEGFKVVAAVTHDPDGPHRNIIFQLAEFRAGRMMPIRERIVWPARFANQNAHLYPLLGLQIL